MSRKTSSVKKQTAGRESAPGSTAPEWGKRIAALRDALGLNGAEFAERLELTPAAISYWESNRKEPSVGTYIRLGNLAAESGTADPLWFYERAGVNPAHLPGRGGHAANERLVRSILGRVDKVAKRFEDDLRHGRFAVVPLLKRSTHIAAPLAAPDEDVEDWVALPLSWITSPASTSLLRVDDPPLTLGGGDLALVDASRTDAESLWGDMVVASHRGTMAVGWLHPFARDDGRRIRVLTRTRTPEETFALSQFDMHLPKGVIHNKLPAVVNMLAVALAGGWAVPMEPEPDWHILGRVTRWIASAPAVKK